MARDMVQETMAYFDNMSTTIFTAARWTWEREISHAESQRLNNPSGMDILGARDVDSDHSHLLPNQTVHPGSGPNWLHMALAIEERQYVIVLSILSDYHLLTCRIDIQDRVRRLNHEPRENARLEVDRLRQTLTTDLLSLQSVRMSQEAVSILDAGDIGNECPDEFDDLDGDANLPEQPFHRAELAEEDLLPPERRPVVLPSTHMPNNEALRKAELRLRMRQVSRYLTSVREAIAEKSFQYSHVMRVAPSKGVRTRSRAIISKINERLGYCCRMYGCARGALVRLNADENTLNKFQTLGKDDVKSSTAILDPNVPGASSQRLSWIWQTRSGSATTSPESMMECVSSRHRKQSFDILIFLVQRVHWLRARAQKHRWHEELVIVKHEMEWTTRYFLHRARQWTSRAEEFSEPGPKAYASRQSSQWRQLACDAEKMFRVVNSEYVKLLVT